MIQRDIVEWINKTILFQQVVNDNTYKINYMTYSNDDFYYIDLDVKAHDYIISQLMYGDRLSLIKLISDKTNAWKAHAILPKSCVQDYLYDFNHCLTPTLPYRETKVAPSEFLTGFILDYLHNNENAIIIFPDFNYTKSWGIEYEADVNYFFHNDEIYYYLDRKSTQKSIADTIETSYSLSIQIGMIVNWNDANIKLTPNQDYDESILQQFSQGVSQLIVGVYDQESYLIAEL